MDEAKKNELIPSASLPSEPSPSVPPPSYDDVANANKLPPLNPREPQRLAPINRATDKVAPQAPISSTEPTPLAVTAPTVLIQPPTQLVILNGADSVTQCPRCRNLTYEIGYPCIQLWLVIAGIVLFFPIGLLFLLCLEKKRLCLKCEKSF